MNRYQKISASVLLNVVYSLLCLLTNTTIAQDYAPHIGYVYPAGGRTGTTFRVEIGGQYLLKPTAAIISGTGVKAVVIPTPHLLTGKEAAAARSELKALRQQHDRQSRSKIQDLNQSLRLYETSKIYPAIGEKAILEITIAPDADIGDRDLRLLSETGLTNSLKFQVGSLPEWREAVSEEAENWSAIQKTINTPESRAKADRSRKPPLPVTLPATLNGRILPGETDRFLFPATKGSQLTIDVCARGLIPYLADTVPGWIQPHVTLIDPLGKELPPLKTEQISPDPLLTFDIPATGNYIVAIRDNIYRGREDFVYRLCIGKAQTLKSLKRPTGELPFPTWVRTPEQEPNNTPKEAQPLPLPCMVSGCINQPGDTDVFRFSGRKGERIVAEVYARRLDSPLDSILLLSDAKGNRIAFNDDHEDKGDGLNTHHADSYLTCTIPSDGLYTVHVCDTQQNGGKAFKYLLRLSPPQPDFALLISPASLNIRANASQPVTVQALRRDGFNGPITLHLSNLPEGWHSDGAMIPAGADTAQWTITAPNTGDSTPCPLIVDGSATIKGKKRTHRATPVQQMTQAFAYHHLVPCVDTLLYLSNKFPLRDKARLITPAGLILTPGQSTTIEVETPRYSAFDAHSLQLLTPPNGITLQHFTITPQRITLTFSADTTKASPGLKGNLIVAFIAKDPTPAGAPKINPKRIPLGTLPAIPFTIIQKAH